MLERGTQSRRGFMQTTMGTLGAMGLPAWYAREVYGAQLQPATESVKVKASDKLNFGWVGIGSPSSRALQVYNRTKPFKQVNHVAVCDVDKRHVERAGGILKKDGFETTAYEDYRQLIAHKDIDVVCVTTPDHWHALVAIEAMKAGKDVYCEKPLTLTVKEALAVIAAQEKTGKVLQTGSQQRSEYGGMFRLAAEIVRSGRIGKLKAVECRIGTNPTSGSIKQAEVPEGLNWDLWLGPTPKVPYLYENNNRTNCHYQFRWFGAYSGGKMTDWGAHHIDIAQWALDMDGNGPKEIECTEMSEIYDKGDGYDWPQTFKVRMVYPNGVPVTVMSNKGTDPGKLVDKSGNEPAKKKTDGNTNGILFMGEEGTLFVGRDRLVASDAKIISEPMKESEMPKLYDGRPTDHMGNFLDCVKTRKAPICSAQVGGGSVIICHLGAIALRMGQGVKLNYDAAKHQFVGNDKANAMLGREYRGEWKLDG